MTIQWYPKLEQGDESLFLTIVQALEGDITSGKLPPESRLPTHRELADQLGVAIGTVTRAYSEAELRGLIHSEGRRGTFVGESQKGKSLLSTLVEMDSRSIDLSKNHPSETDDPDLSVALRQIARKPDIQQLLQYGPAAGLLHHRTAGADWLKKLGMKTDPDSVVISAGAQHGIMSILAAIAERGDVVLTETVTYPGIKAIADTLGLQLVGVPMDRYGVLPDELTKLCRQRKVRTFYCNPTIQNPTTVIYSKSRRQAVASIAEKYNITIIEDDLLRPLVSKPPAFISSYAPNRSFLVMSASKVIAAGLRVGFIVPPSHFKQNLIDSIRTTLLTPSALPSEVLTNWLENGTADKIIKKRVQELKKRQLLVAEILNGFKVQSCSTGSHIWLHLPGEWTSMEFTLEAHRRGVAVAPSEIFTVDKKTEVNAVRVTIAAQPQREPIKNGLEILAGILKGIPLQDSQII
jgi:DNA-binding transcriptional MocR family regulator